MWRIRRPSLVVLLVVDGLALIATGAIVWHIPVHGNDWVVFGILAGASILHMEAVPGVERIRQGLPKNAPYVDLKSVWTFAGLLLLPPSLAAALVAITFVHLRLRQRMDLFRWLYGCATVLLATYAAESVLYAGLPAGGYPGLPHSWRGVAVVVGAAAIRWFVNFALIVLIILLSAPKTPAEEALGSFTNSLVEVASLSLGAVTALVTVVDPWYLALIMPLLLVLHRNLMLRQYEVAARTDTKTGLANAMHWTQMARGELARAERDGTVVGVVMLDLDHFKRVNDTYGHLTGDAVLKAVADALRKTTREDDLVGRFGGEEFMILAPGIDYLDLAGVAERFRRCVGSLSVTSPDTREQVTVTASAGAVAFPDGGGDLDELLLAADAALYRAKEAGRDRTCCAAQAVVQADLPKARQPDEH